MSWGKTLVQRNSWTEIEVTMNAYFLLVHILSPYFDYLLIYSKKRTEKRSYCFIYGFTDDQRGHQPWESSSFLFLLSLYFLYLSLLESVEDSQNQSCRILAALSCVKSCFILYLIVSPYASKNAVATTVGKSFIFLKLLLNLWTNKRHLIG